MVEAKVYSLRKIEVRYRAKMMAPGEENWLGVEDGWALAVRERK